MKWYIFSNKGNCNMQRTAIKQFVENTVTERGSVYVAPDK